MTGPRADSNTESIGGLPAEISDSSLLWSGKVSPPDSYIIQLQQDEVSEVDQALELFKQLELDGDEISQHTFPLPTLQDKLRRLAIEIHNGKGFGLLRGLDPSQYSVEDLLLVYLGLASYIGDERGVQNRKGDMLTHIVDSHHWTTVPYELRHGIHTNKDLPFHSDMGASILALQFRQCAMQGGGETMIASASTMYNELYRNHPQKLTTLAKPNWPIQVSGNPPRYILAPLIQYHDGNILLSFDPGRLGNQYSDKDSRQIPELTSSQLQALETLSELAEEHCVKIAAQPGDILFVNNWALVHGREAYQDGSDTRNNRHAVRLWLHNTELGWKIPPNMKVPWDAAFGPADANDFKSTPSRNYPVVPTRDYKPPKYTSGSAAFLLEDSDEGEA